MKNMHGWSMLFTETDFNAEYYIYTMDQLGYQACFNEVNANHWGGV